MENETKNQQSERIFVWFIFIIILLVGWIFIFKNNNDRSVDYGWTLAATFVILAPPLFITSFHFLDKILSRSSGFAARLIPLVGAAFILYLSFLLIFN